MKYTANKKKRGPGRRAVHSRRCNCSEAYRCQDLQFKTSGLLASSSSAFCTNYKRKLKEIVTFELASFKNLRKQECGVKRVGAITWARLRTEDESFLITRSLFVIFSCVEVPLLHTTPTDFGFFLNLPYKRHSCISVVLNCTRKFTSD